MAVYKQKWVLIVSEWSHSHLSGQVNNPYLVYDISKILYIYNEQPEGILWLQTNNASIQNFNDILLLIEVTLADRKLQQIYQHFQSDLFRYFLNWNNFKIPFKEKWLWVIFIIIFKLYRYK